LLWYEKASLYQKLQVRLFLEPELVLQKFRIGRDSSGVLAGEQPNEYEVRFGGIWQFGELVIVEQSAMEFNPGRITVLVVLELGPVLHQQHARHERAPRSSRAAWPIAAPAITQRRH
jgi:hypothetical protein